MTAKRFFTALLLGAFLAIQPLMATPAAESPKVPEIEIENFQGQDFLVRQVDPKLERIHIYLKDDSGKPLRSFTALSKYTAAHRQTLDFAANAGMFEEDRSTVGLLIQSGKVVRKLNLRDAKGNFYLKPNGVFYIDRHHKAKIVESSRFAGLEDSALWATQSGPLLLDHGKFHPAFKKDSVNRLVRSGVGITETGTAIFVLSKGVVNFYQFAEYFRSLGCPNALFLDGTISAFYSPAQPNEPPLHNFGPMVGVIRLK